MSKPGQDRSAAPRLEGTLIAGRFRVERELGSGGMARVFRAEDIARRKPIALKVLRSEIANHPEAVERLRREGQILTKLAHPGIVAIETFGKLEDGRIFLAMELLEGETLGSRIRRGRLSPGEVTGILEGVASALDAAHAHGVVHRDLKPDNVFLVATKDGEPSIKLLDFGIAKGLEYERLTQTGQLLGTPRYMAPEQLAAADRLDHRIDFYALGVILYEALAGQPPFTSNNPSDLVVAILRGRVVPLRSVRPEISVALEAVVARAMARAPEARYESAGEILRAWKAALPAVVEDRDLSGHRTSMLGAFDPAPAPSASPDDVRPGTFSAFASHEPKAETLRATPAPVALAARSSPVPVVAPVPVEPASEEAPISIPPVRSRRRLGLPLPLLVLLALLAGGASAAVAVVMLHALAEDEDEPAPSALPPPPSRATPAHDVVPEVVPAPAAAPGEPLPEGVAPPEIEAPPELPAPPRAPAPRAHAPRAPGPSVDRRARPVAPASPPPAAADDPGTLLRAAREAYAAGQPERCLDLVARALEHGAPVIALRLEGDCYRRRGDQRRALASYERFCALAGDHPSIGEVRALVDALGGRCR